MAATLHLLTFVLIGGLIVIGLLAGIGLVLMSWLREREDVDTRADVTPAVTRQDRAA
jgi:hypothetical protein